MADPRTDYRALMETAKRINLGCGTTAPAGWLNVDRSPGLLLTKFPGARRIVLATGLLPRPQAQVDWPEGIRRLDVTKGLPFQASSAEAIYSSHMLEHLPHRDAIHLLAECRRVLDDGGVSPATRLTEPARPFSSWATTRLEITRSGPST